MQGDLNWSTGKKTATGKSYQQSISQGQFYTLLSRAKSRDKVSLLNIDPEDINVNESALDEMFRMRNELLFSWQHLLTELNGIFMCLFNVRSWNVHLEHFLSDKIYSTYSSLFCFTETNINDSPAKHIDETWMIEKTSIRIHSMAWLYMIKVNITEVIEIPSVLKVLSIVLKI